MPDAGAYVEATWPCSCLNKLRLMRSVHSNSVKRSQQYNQGFRCCLAPLASWETCQTPQQWMHCSTTGKRRADSLSCLRKSLCLSVSDSLFSSLSGHLSHLHILRNFDHKKRPPRAARYATSGWQPARDVEHASRQASPNAAGTAATTVPLCL